jgi:hypothetical protein
MVTPYLAWVQGQGGASTYKSSLPLLTSQRTILRHKQDKEQTAVINGRGFMAKFCGCLKSLISNSDLSYLNGPEANTWL